MQENDLCDRMGIPVHKGDSKEMLRRLMATRNEWKLYKRKCDNSGQSIISAYPPDAPFPVFSNAIWWGDTWNPMDYGKDFDFGRPFFEQFKELQHAVPREGTSIVNCDNCDFNSHTRESRNCYMCSLMVDGEDVLYSYWIVGSRDTADSMHTHRSTLCYWCSDVENGYNCVLLEAGRDCTECYFSYDLKGCRNCIFSSNLSNKEFYAFNKQCSKDEFEALKQKYLNGSWTSWQDAYAKFLELRGRAVHRSAQIISGENVTGDHLHNCKNCIDCYDSDNSEDCENSISASHSKNIVKAYSAGWKGCEMVYCSCVTRGSIDIAFCMYTWSSHRLRYCDSCASCSDCFGCIGLRHTQYCILNKQYSKEDYEKLLPRIIEHMKSSGEWGEFFPQAHSVFAYNESAANDYFPLRREQAIERGFRWKDEERGEYESATCELPDKRQQAKNVTDEILACVSCRKNYRIISQELALCEKLNLPLPRQCPSCRHAERFSFRNPYYLFERPCGKCGMNIKSTYSAARKEKVYCEACYLKNAY